ncbi:YozE family protein, partial [Staphylococcus epidermidis]
MMRVGGRKEDKGVFGEEIFEEVGFGKEEDDFNRLSEYIETDREL